MAQTVPSSALAHCAAIESDPSRLKCYDQIAKAHNINEDSDPTTRRGKWTIVNKVDPIDDTKTVNISLEADSGGSRFSKPIMLVARCDSKKTEMYIDWQTYLGSEADVTLRIGNNAAHTSKWAMPRGKQQTFSHTPIAMLKDMLTANKMVAQVTPFNQKPYTAVFDTSGLDNAITALREACAW
nr:type VI secretion system-associated protein TagO [Oceanisphaera pacifica]